MTYRVKKTPRLNGLGRSKDRPKVAILHPRLVEGGGSESRPLRVAQALKSDYQVSLITMGRVDLQRLNESYGTNLKAGEIEIIEIPIPFPFRNRFDALRSYRLARYSKQRAFDFDVVISTYNVMDFGRKGIQFIADFSFDDKLRRAFDCKPGGLRTLVYRASPFRWVYLKLSDLLSGTNRDQWKRNVTIVNSDWSGEVIRRTYGVRTRRIYPPVAEGFPIISWDNRENGFVCIGRLVPEKGIDKIIGILGKVRREGWGGHLHIIGAVDNSDYVRKLKQLCQKNREWIFIEGPVFGQRKLDFIARHKFAISGRENEPFGIAVAEMLKGGCIVWVPNGGGQVEIVRHPTLIYNDMEDALRKIGRVLHDETEQIILREYLGRQSEKFSAQRFVSEIRTIVEEFLEGNGRKEE